MKASDMSNPTPDPKAIAAAKRLRQDIDADCVLLFGSRARTDWTDASDLDLVVLNNAMPDQGTMLDTQDRATQIAVETFGRPVTVDVLFMTHGDFRLLSGQTINHVAARARKQGIFMPRNTEDYGSTYDDHEDNEQLEYQERERRIADANVHYRNMHGLLDLGFEDKDTAFLAQQAIENAMKALISALGEEYNTHHSTRAFARDIRRLDPSGGNWNFASNLGQLDNFAGGNRYGPTITPISDYREMANNVTEDLDRIYERIRALTGTDPWRIPPEGTTQGIEPRWRPPQ